MTRTNSSKSRLTPIAVVLACVIGTPLVVAHGAPPPPEYLRRLLHDCNDDYFGGDIAQDKEGQDLIALDLQEAFDASLGKETVRFRLIMDAAHIGTSGPSLRDEITFTAGGTTKTYALATTDNQRFTGDFDRIDGPKALMKSDGHQDGTRFFVDGILTYASAGVAAGTAIQDYRVTGFVGNQKADFMPGTFRTSFGSDAPAATACAEGESQTKYEAGAVRLQGSSRYTSVTLEPRTVSLQVGEETLVAVRILNLLKTQPQDVVVTSTVSPGVSTRFHVDAGDADLQTYEGALAKASELFIHLVLNATQPGSGSTTVTVTTNLGGRTIADVSYEAVGGDADAIPPANQREAASSPEPSKGAAAGDTIPLAFVAAAAAVGLLWGRRR